MHRPNPHEQGEMNNQNRPIDPIDRGALDAMSVAVRVARGQPEQPQSYGYDEYEGLRHVHMIGTDDPLERAKLKNAAFPFVSYHAAPSKAFIFDEMFDGGMRGVGNNILGDGLYVGDRELGMKYARYLGRSNQSVALTELYPKNARILDLSGKQPKMELSMMKELRSFIIARTPEDDEQKVNQNSLRKLIDTSLKSGKRISSVVNWLGTHDAGLVAQEFLMAKGIDGVSRVIHPRVGGRHTIVNYWRNDRIGDVKTWERRQRRQQVIDTIGTELNSHMYATQKHKPDFGNPMALVEQELSRQDAQKIFNGGLELNPRAAESIWQLLGDKNSNPFGAVAALAAASPEMTKILSAQVGLWERYTLHEHTQAVLGQFDKHFGHYFEDNTPELVNARAFIRTTLLLQDIGKSVNHSLGKPRSEQAPYNKLAAQQVLHAFPISNDAKALIADLVGQNAIGTALKSRRMADVNQAVETISHLADKHKIFTKRELGIIAEMIYKADASAYTADASYIKVAPQTVKRTFCLGSLDSLFRKSSRAKPIAMSDNAERIMKHIRKRLQQDDPDSSVSQTIRI